MARPRAALTLLVLVACGAGSAAEPNETVLALPRILAPLHRRLPEAHPGEWRHKVRESDQSLDAYMAECRLRESSPSSESGTVYFLPLGDLSRRQQGVLADAATYAEACFGFPVQTLPARAMPPLPPSAVRRPAGRARQVSAQHLLLSVLPECAPKDTAALVAVTAEDLHPGAAWGNRIRYVFGLADTRTGMAVVTFARFPDPGRRRREMSAYRLRLLKTVAHELGHALQLSHCSRWRCCMNGRASLAETDAAPLWLCPACAAKVCWRSGLDPEARYARLAEVCRSLGLRSESDFFSETSSHLMRQGLLLSKRENPQSLTLEPTE